MNQWFVNKRLENRLAQVFAPQNFGRRWCHLMILIQYYINACFIYTVHVVVSFVITGSYPVFTDVRFATFFDVVFIDLRIITEVYIRLVNRIYTNQYSGTLYIFFYLLHWVCEKLKIIYFCDLNWEADTEFYRSQRKCRGMILS